MSSLKKLAESFSEYRATGKEIVCDFCFYNRAEDYENVYECQDDNGNMHMKICKPCYEYYKVSEYQKCPICLSQRK